MPLTVRPWGACLALVLLCQPLAVQAQTVSKDECIDANEAAQQLKQRDALSEARLKVEVCQRPECPAPVRADCAELASAIAAAMPSIVISAYDARGVRLENVRVTSDGKPLTEKLDGTPIELDPGSHQLELTALGQPSAREWVQLSIGEKRELRVDLVDKRGRLFKGLGIGAGVAGVVTVSLGAYLGWRAKSNYDDALEECPAGPSSCSAVGVAGGKKAHDQAASSTVAFVVGGLLLAGGGALYWYGSKLTVAPVTTGQADGSVVVSGAW
jgi:hypothetical protein